jgi:hypothetical protein
MSENTNDNYWSDEEQDNPELIQDSRDLPPIEYDSEEEEEYNNILRIVHSKLKDENPYKKLYKSKDNKLDTYEKPKKKSKKIKSNKNNKILLNLSEINEKKKWKSKRMIEKTGPEVVKRKFNPRLPTPGNKFKISKNKVDNKIDLEADFPSL